jgi:hypothetical protein
MKMDMGRTLKYIAAGIILMGIVCCLVNIAKFNDDNLGLMVGIGFLVGGSQIMLFGAMAPLMQKHREKADDDLPAAPPETVQ